MNKAVLRTGYRQFRLGGDVALAGWEYVAQLVYGPFVLGVAPRATGARAVITLPGFTGDDGTVAPLNDALRALGYTADSWGLGRNRGIADRRRFEEQTGLIARRADELAQRTGAPVALVGHSLGGVFARETARRFPCLIDRVVTLGSPTRAGLVGDAPPGGVPLVAVYSPLDDIAPVRATRIADAHLADSSGAPRENVEVLCSHLGMAFNPLVQLVVADRLAEPAEAWRPFDAARYFPPPVRLAHTVFYPPVVSSAP
jgi:pimeloyl-ACP methyl ester carboxylesterase